MISKSEWNEYAESSPFPYYTLYYEWLSALEKTYPHFQKEYLSYKNSILPFIIDRKNNILASPSPYGGIGGPTNLNHLKEYVKKLDEFASQNKIKEIQIFFPFISEKHKEILEKSDYILGKQIYMIINTQREIEEIFRNIKEGKRRKIKKMHKKMKINIFYSPSKKHITEFYNIYLKVMEKNNALLIFPKNHFENIAKEFGKKVILEFIHDENEKILGSSFLIESKDMISTYFTVVKPEYYKTRAADVLIWNLIKRCAENGKKYADLGPSAYGSSNFIFKKEFGAEVFEFITAKKYQSKWKNIYYKQRKKVGHFIRKVLK